MTHHSLNVAALNATHLKVMDQMNAQGHAQHHHGHRPHMPRPDYGEDDITRIFTQNTDDTEKQQTQVQVPDLG